MEKYQNDEKTEKEEKPKCRHRHRKPKRDNHPKLRPTPCVVRRRQSVSAGQVCTRHHVSTRHSGTSYTPSFAKPMLCFPYFSKKKQNDPGNKRLVTNKKWKIQHPPEMAPNKVSPIRKKRDGQFLPNKLTANNSSNR